MRVKKENINLPLDNWETCDTQVTAQLVLEAFRDGLTLNEKVFHAFFIF